MGPDPSSSTAFERALVRASPDATYVIDGNGVVLWANPAVEEALGWAPEAVVGRNVVDFTHPDDLALVLASLQSMRGLTVGNPIEVRSLHPSGEWRTSEVVARNCLADPLIAGIVVTSRDLTRRRMWDVAGGDDVRFNRAVQHAPALLLLLDADGVITSVNGAFTRLLGWDVSEIVGRRLIDFVDDEHDRERFEAAVADSRVGATSRVEAMMATSDGRPPVPVRFAVANLLDDPLVGSLAVTGHDISELHEARRRLEHLATHDALTDLPNRAMLMHRLDELLASHRPLALLYVDLDRFKPVNDRFGHGAGDEVLRRVAQRLRDAVMPADLVARIGGDEFVTVAVGLTDADAAAELADALRRAIEEPFQLLDGTVSIGASIGVAIAHPGSTADSLLHEADGAMYRRKPADRPDDR